MSYYYNDINVLAICIYMAAIFQNILDNYLEPQKSIVRNGSIKV